MKLSKRVKHFLTILVASPLLALVMLAMVFLCLMLPLACLVWPEIMERDEVKP